MQSSSGSTSTTTTRHIPVLLQEVLEVLDIQENDTVLDGTVGGGGHTAAFLEHLGRDGTLVGFDVDSDALTRVRLRVGTPRANLILIQDNFRNVSAQLAIHGVAHVDKALFDLGWSSDQLEVSERGFSFNRDEPLLMTLGNEVTEETITARDIVNTWQEESIADVLYGWGGERNSRKIARAIVEARKVAPIETSGQLAAIVERVLPRRGKSHPATKTFQALRIAVNDELGALKELLTTLPSIVEDNATVAFLTFHSLEDKLVKETFRGWAREGKGTIITKKPVTATATEVGHNPRSSSAKLRAFAFTHYEEHTHFE